MIDNLNDYEIVDIYYDKDDMLYGIGCKLLDSFDKKVRKEFDDNFKSTLLTLMQGKINQHNIDLLCNEILSEFKSVQIPSDELIIDTTNKYIDMYFKFENMYNEILKQYNSNYDSENLDFWYDKSIEIKKSLIEVKKSIEAEDVYLISLVDETNE